jgi:hypothetical protein
LELNEDDVEALEYAGQQLLRIPDPGLALDYFARLGQQATLRQDVLLAARSKVLQARANYAFPLPNLAAANTILIQVVGGFPTGMPMLERAMIYELHGDIRRDSGFAVAHNSYMAALMHYSNVKELKTGNVEEAAQGASRVSLKIAQLNDDEGATPEAPDGGPARN